MKGNLLLSFIPTGQPLLCTIRYRNTNLTEAMNITYYEAKKGGRSRTYQDLLYIRTLCTLFIHIYILIHIYTYIHILVLYIHMNNLNPINMYVHMYVSPILFRTNACAVPGREWVSSHHSALRQRAQRFAILHRFSPHTTIIDRKIKRRKQTPQKRKKKRRWHNWASPSLWCQKLRSSSLNWRKWRWSGSRPFFFFLHV